MKNTQELNDIYYLIGKLREAATILKDSNSRFYEYSKDCEILASNAEKSYEKIRKLIS